MSLSQSERYLHIQTRIEETSEAEDFSFYQAEQIKLGFSTTSSNGRVQVPEGGSCRMEAWIDGTPETLYISKTGTVDRSTRKSEVTLIPSESNMATGDYLYTVKVFDADDIEMGIVASGGYTVMYSPNTDAVDYVGTVPYIDIDQGTTTETNTALRLAPDGLGGVEWAVTDGASGNIEDSTTIETNTAKVIKPDGLGGVSWEDESGGGGGHGGSFYGNIRGHDSFQVFSFPIKLKFYNSI